MKKVKELVFSASTERLQMAPLQSTDTAFIFELLNTEGWIKNIGNRHIQNHEDALAYIEKINGNENYAYNVVRITATNEAAGLVTFIKRDTQPYPDFGFAFLPQYAGKGYAYESALAYLQFLQENSGYKTFAGITLQSNTPSITLLKKLGFTLETAYKDDDEKLYRFLLNI